MESEEARLLTWGYVDGGFTLQEIEKRAGEYCIEVDSIITADFLIGELIKRRLIIELPLRPQALWRTRMAETVRLMANLRQWFHYHKNWKMAPSLVSDFRFVRRARRYPKRNVSKHHVLSHLQPFLNKLQVEAADHLLPGQYSLSKFQIDAAKRMLQDLKARTSKGMIVCAGTGTGKTLSFYLPALTHIADLIVKSRNFWTKAIALYPRNELLKDQFMETYMQARKLDDWLLQRTGRPLRIGAFFGLTPDRAEKIEDKWTYDRVFQGYICPYMICPKEAESGKPCGSPLIWRKVDVRNKREALYCSDGSCGNEIPQEHVVLTREMMRENPPDLVFTTTEMLNRSMSDLKSRKVFGLYVDQPPQIMLLDEVHTYSGVHGAQVALLLRRWRHVINSPVHFTGLSATLNEAGEFFSQLTGLSRNAVEQIEVEAKEMIDEGQEYQLILRGDPTSNTSLLSTTIQASMLMRRMLDLADSHPSGGIYGERAFIFTDDLDVTNRLYHTLLDAEGRYSSGKPNLSKEPLAALRNPDISINSNQIKNTERLRYGQSWMFSEKIGHDPNVRLEVGRTSSQDSGVDAGRDLIVATASLEVGYNDPVVGAVIQHKAPLDMASFLQRKGRAGRKRGMRPWMVTILSDFGRDRMLYQGYEMLFDPILERRSLPVQNRYVLKMQAVFCMMEWLAEEVRKKSNPYGSLWNDLSAPPLYKNAVERQKVAIQLIRRILEDNSYRRLFETYLRKALAISKDDVTALLWEPPRSLMVSVFPSLLRRLEKSWAVYWNRNLKEPYKFGNPLPEFIPSNLFSDLNLPEVCITLPLDRYGRKSEPQWMPIEQAMNQFAPGRVTRRFGVKQISTSHWVPPVKLEPSDEPQLLPISSFSPHTEEVGWFQMETNNGVVSVPCLRPWEITPNQPDDSVNVTSNARLVWKSQIFPSISSWRETGDSNKGMRAEVPLGTPWRSIFSEVQFYTHNLNSTVTARRFAVGSEATIKLKPNQKMDLSLRFCDDEQNQVALGFELEVDGICFRYNLPPLNTFVDLSDNSELLRSCRTAYFHHLVKTDERLNRFANVFDRERLSELYLSALAAKSLEKGITLQEAHDEWNNTGHFISDMEEVLDVIFPSIQQSEEGIGDEDTPEQRQKLYYHLQDLYNNQEVFGCLHDVASVLWGPLGQAWQEYLRDRWTATLGAALLQACKDIAVNSESGDLLLDVNGGPRPEGVESIPEGMGEIWITETSIGGSGVIEEIVEQYHADPRRFFRLVESALGNSELEFIDAELSRSLELLVYDSDAQILLENVRSATGYEETEPAVEELYTYLKRKGILLTHSVLSAINNRLLKPGSSLETDRLMFQLIQMWRKEEKRLGIELDSRVFLFVFSSNESLHRPFANAFRHLDPQMVNDQNWRFQVLYSLLWPRGNSIRTRALDPYNPYATKVLTDRELLLMTFDNDCEVQLEDAEYKEKVLSRLEQKGIANLSAPVERASELKAALIEFATNPVESGFLHLYPRAESLQRNGNRILVTLDLREAIQ